jgi:hypothetical protein
MRDRQSADEVEHLDHGFALGPIVGNLGLELIEADLGVVLVGGLVDGEEDMVH